ncbi:YcnI family copper-binding membrane protein [Candidatus Nitrosacidococcus tergens]|uniref:YcnI family copper-binding membrane protein n=1 Tax=Candidatus Nitrosacidococcus tergens TaxID=553981 RepID=UPI0018D82083|nr:YcnI family protein [Candidatus Nitrosacidococcus tergens]
MQSAPSAPVGNYYKTVLGVPHGCEGSDTVKLKVRIPEGVLTVKPQPKAGWQLDIIQGKYDHPQSLFGTQIDSGVKEIDWTGKLSDAHYEEFAFVGYLSSSLKPDQTLYFLSVQECVKGASRWIDTSGKLGVEQNEGGDYPAPGLRLTAPVNTK